MAIFKQRVGGLIISLRNQVRTFSAVEQVIFIIAFVVISVRVILPILHLDDGQLLFWYPFKDSAVCLTEEAKCGIDRSRTAVEAGGVGLCALGLIVLNRGFRQKIK